MYRIFDWKKATQIILEKNLDFANAGLIGDWENTAAPIFENGKPVTRAESQFFSMSDWAVPTIEYYDRESRMMKKEECFYESETSIPRPDEVWPIEALIYFLEKSKESRVETFKDRQVVIEKVKADMPKEEMSLESTNGLKAIEAHCTALMTEIERIRRAAKEKSDKEALKLKALIVHQVEPLVSFLRNVKKIKNCEDKKEQIREYNVRLIEIFAEIFSVLNRIMEASEGTDDLMNTGMLILDFMDKFQSIMEEIFLKNLRNVWGAAADILS